MTINERRTISAITSPGNRIRALTTVWCVKEAYVKAIGEGVGFGLEHIDVILDQSGEVPGVLVDGLDIRESESGWTIKSGYLDAGTYRWVCIYEGPPDDTGIVTPMTVDWKEMISRFSQSTH